MMPLKYLMKNDAIEKAAQPKPKQYAGRYWKISVFHFKAFLSSNEKPSTAISRI